MKLEITIPEKLSEIKLGHYQEFAKHCRIEGIKIDCKIDKGELYKELECLKSYALDKEGKIQLMPKEKIKEIIGHSPDLLDAIIMRMIFNLEPNKGKYYVY